MNRVYLSIGSNIGNREENLKKAIEELKNYGLVISKISSIYNTSPWGFTEQEDFLNMALEVYTTLEPLELLKCIKKIEKNLGRTDTIKYGPRIIDIDIIFYNDLILKSKELIIPHPLMHERYFVLKPLSEIAPDFVHPEIGLTVQKLLEKL
ncbi:2-amino-4-hydroxy-6-hydroxymethyldihydropteridine diphosphokinase [Thermodesulfovibrio sp. 1176]|uniref:2-amino-4-hydroxy-6- hydroxymethyldihydropteridine diphosphokinase n=1 Tax=Thermodesulfovibrio sp. 1176 TaxID=3043424 RepID=UPI0024826E55|nr:2-amino-4-hydroxy-6-hydroxymethyldihydropteridine diphosphokinase [Thermodesulfovibrio sp. 1176]MDI1472334.1 2-amino-4-hydroxy-6-hydroxymethyldihydropteridine diphosphokinase [Thermodesulfovibrio sp. 1176]